MAIGRKDKTPLEEVKNILVPLARITDTHPRTRSVPDAKPNQVFPGLETPTNRNTSKPPAEYQASAMKGVVFTATGEVLATPAPAELTNLFVNSPRVGLNFAKIFDFEEGEIGPDHGEEDSDVEGPPPSPSIRDRAKSSESQRSCHTSAPPTRLRRPSILRPVQRPGLPASTSDPTGLSPPTPLSNTVPCKQPPSSATAANSAPKPSDTMPQPSPPAPKYDFADEENLPSPFLRRTEKEKAIPPSGPGAMLKNKGPSKRLSGGGNLLRVVAAANVANANVKVADSRPGSAGKGSLRNFLTRPSVTSARKASEEARKALLRE